MTIANIACPKCTQTFRSSDDVKDTRIRCPLCGFAFVVADFVADNGPRLAKPKAKANANEEDDDPNPYGVKSIDIKPRCPHCANEMEDDEAIICLHCGYNTQTRSIGKTKRVIHQTGGDRTKWLMPGIACAAAVFGLLLAQNIFILGFGESMRSSESWVAFFFSEPAYMWVTMFMAAAIWVLGRFAFKRLVLEPTPPEEVVE